MTTGAEAVLDRMEADSTFAERVKDAGGPEASLELLRSEGFQVDRDQLRDAVLDRYGDTLTQEQLDALAGGMSGEELLYWGGVGVAGAVVTAVAAMAATV
jgi:predicted ribosomally synthesized peptide with nif11-like leader